MDIFAWWVSCAICLLTLQIEIREPFTHTWAILHSAKKKTLRAGRGKQKCAMPFLLVRANRYIFLGGFLLLFFGFVCCAFWCLLHLFSLFFLPLCLYVCVCVWLFCLAFALTLSLFAVLLWCLSSLSAAALFPAFLLCLAYCFYFAFTCCLPHTSFSHTTRKEGEEKERGGDFFLECFLCIHMSTSFFFSWSLLFFLLLLHLHQHYIVCTSVLFGFPLCWLHTYTYLPHVHHQWMRVCVCLYVCVCIARPACSLHA